MKKIVWTVENAATPITVDDALEDPSNRIIVYLAQNGTGVAILQPVHDGWSFQYHSDLVQNIKKRGKYLSGTKKDAITLALCCKELYTFEYFPEFLEFAAKHSKL
jgi:hypothetical protein